MEFSLAISRDKMERISNNSDTLNVSVTTDWYAVRDHVDCGSFWNVG